MINFVLLSGLDGTGKLFKPFLEKKPKHLTANFFIYDLNADNNQTLIHQATCIEQQVADVFGQEPVHIIAESYSGLLAYELLKRQSININTVFFIACFLERPFQLARLASLLEPKMTVAVKDRLLAFQLFNRYKTTELITLFRQAMRQLNAPKNRKRFKARCRNIANASLPNQKITNQNKAIKYVYFQAKQDNVISKRHLKAFEILMDDLHIFELDGSHFLLQTNPEKVWQLIEKILTHENE